MMGLMMGQRKIIYVVLSLLIISFALIGATVYHFRVEKPRIASITSAMTRYQKVVDAEWNNSNCTIANCPQSSKRIPGVPPDRESLTAAERFNLEIRGGMATVLPITQAQSDIVVYNVKGRIDGTVTAIIYVTTTKHYQGDDTPSSETIPHKVTLLPAKDAQDGYVVMADEPLDQVKEHLPDLVFPND